MIYSLAKHMMPPMAIKKDIKSRIHIISNDFAVIVSELAQNFSRSLFLCKTEKTNFLGRKIKKSIFSRIFGSELKIQFSQYYKEMGF